METIQTERLVLEPLTEAHAEEMFRILGDPVIYTFLRERPPFTVDEVRARYRYLEERRSPDGSQSWLNWIVRDAVGDAVGFVQATVYSGGGADIAYVLTPTAWGKGYAREACKVMIGELVAAHGVTTCFATVAPRNMASIGVLQALGFRLVSPVAVGAGQPDIGDFIYQYEP